MRGKAGKKRIPKNRHWVEDAGGKQAEKWGNMRVLRTYAGSGGETLFLLSTPRLKASPDREKEKEILISSEER